MGVEVVPQTVISPVQSRQEIPLIPTDAGHPFKKGKDVDTDHTDGLATYEAFPPTAQTTTKRPQEIPKNVQEEQRC